ncbi:hypothetical protein [Streptosporangium sp. V21-05]|uniref:hypothetical protein n=1 Tax=Streptosporangium sp. V21-05 TaxID=3446115 RepID=UPI003F533696
MLAEAVEVGRLAVEACPPDDPMEGSVLQAYAEVPSESSMRSGDGTGLRGRPRCCPPAPPSGWRA